MLNPKEISLEEFERVQLQINQEAKEAEMRRDKFIKGQNSNVTDLYASSTGFVFNKGKVRTSPFLVPWYEE